MHLDHTSFIDGSIPTTHVLIEQKGLGKDLKRPIKQSDGTLLTPFQQAKRYAAELPYSMRPRWIVTCNFKEFHIYDMERPSGEPEIILLEDLGTENYRLQFLKVLDTKPEDRDPYMDEELASFPYVNGGLFADENIVIPRFDENMKQYQNLVKKA